MRENDFRDRLRDALGDPPPLSAPLLTPSDGAARRAYPRGMAVLAFVLAVLLVLVLVATRVALRPQGTNLPAVKPSPVAQPAPDSFPCALPVVVTSEAGNPGQGAVIRASLGFVNIPGGGFQVDPSASVGDLPQGGPGSPSFYSAALKRWVPASGRTMSPDGRAFAYITLLPAGANYSNFTSSELHIVDIAKRADRRAWSNAAGIEVINWDSAGILASTVPAQGGVRLLWRIDPASGGVSQAPQDADPNFLPMTMAGLPHSGGYSYLGTDSQGRSVFRLGSRDPGTKYSIVAIQAGQVTTLYAGAARDPTDFDPEGFDSDQHGMWLGNFDGSRVWLWSPSSGLQSFKVSGLPPAPSGYAYTNVSFNPAGDCVPGTFTGVAATGLPPAAPPTPSPSPPQVDWSALTAKPVNLQPLPAGASCPVSPKVDLAVKGQSGKWPNYGFGQGPAYVSGQFMWYSAGPQAILILVDPKYTGPVLVRSRRLDGTGLLAWSGEGSTSLPDAGAMGLAQTSSPPYWGTWIGSVTPSAPGCYGIQLDGTSFSAVAVISVSKGPPPAG
ncbi:MAG: hypothetical protein E6I23_11000 [Chloroflexi bacterium]|nr:MAG: hypothetical protein E6I23_11000 [Chloroflexota bacterium]